MRRGVLVLLCMAAALGFSPHARAQEAQKRGGKEMTIEQAYLAIPHKRTQFNPAISTAPDLEKAYLDHLFFVTDLALQKRMMMLHFFGKQNEERYIRTYNTEISNMIATFDMIAPPTEPLKKITETIITALRQQQKFFNDWAAAKGTLVYDRLQDNYTSEIMVISSHNNLITAYNMLKEAYPAEDPHNIQAFYDHLCALDFI